MISNRSLWILGWAVIGLAAVLVFGSVGWAIVAAGTNHAYPNIVWVATFLGLLVSIIGISMACGADDKARVRRRG